MATNDRVRIGVVGVGSISVRGILPHLTQDDVQDRLQVTAVCDPVPGRAEAASEKFNVPHAYEIFEELLADGHVDAVSIASPIGLHYEQGKLAIEHGLHAHFNKTMTTTVDEADDLIESAKRKGVKLVASPGQMLRPIHQEIKRLIDDGAIGTLTWAATGSSFGRYHESESVRQGDDVLSNINPAWYFRKPGGGPLYDMTVYGLHTMTGILGPVKRVTAFSGVRVKEREFRGEMLPCDMDDNTFILLDFGAAFFGFIYGAAAGHAIKGGLSINGTAGVIEGSTINGKPIDAPKRELPHVVGPHRNIQEAHVYEDIMQLVDWIREDKPSIVTAEHARHVIEIFDAGYRSAESGQAQTLRTTF
ncbi:MAG: Gfo/Idh/MocA family oxidoreductase [Candidatus Poribacteria bacterium]|nr:Gfo/Idh/MocA family oxidoreductase [Candidatus Poribacteria bacterium]